MSWEEHQYITINSNYSNKLKTTITEYALKQLDKTKKEKSDLPLSEFVKTLRPDSLSDEERYYIQNITLKEIEDWLREVNDTSMIRYIDTLRTWISHVNPNKPSLIDQALENIANKNPLNNYRVRKMILKS